MLYHIWYNMCMNDSLKILPARFFKTASGTEPVREWLKGLDKEDSRIIGGDVSTVEHDWAHGVPGCRAVKRDKKPLAGRRPVRAGRNVLVAFLFGHRDR